MRVKKPYLRKKKPQYKKMLGLVLVLGVLVCIGVELLFLFPQSKKTSQNAAIPTQYILHKPAISPLPEPTFGPLVAYVPKTDFEQEAYMVLKDYLNKYKPAKILDFVITDIHKPCIVNNALEFGVQFSIKPLAKIDETIGTDNGIPTSDGWVRNKAGIAKADLVSGSYTLEGIATGVGADDPYITQCR